MDRNLEYELCLTVGQEVTSLTCQDNRRKVMLMQTQDVGYIPSHLVLRERWVLQYIDMLTIFYIGYDCYSYACIALYTKDLFSNN